MLNFRYNNCISKLDINKLNLFNYRYFPRMPDIYGNNHTVINIPRMPYFCLNNTCPRLPDILPNNTE